jgi:hypothetical protein
MDETQLRALRAEVYGECTDGNWFAVREHWMEPEAQQFLRDHSHPLPNRVRPQKAK